MALLARLSAVAALSITLIGASPVANATTPRGLICLQLPVAPQSRTPVVWEGQFSAQGARLGQEEPICIHLLVKRRIAIKIDAPGLSTVGHVRFPDGHQEGAPGGRFFDEVLPVGYYLILVGQCWPTWKPGTFKLAVSLE